jgi:hypothetical protein
VWVNRDRFPHTGWTGMMDRLHSPCFHLCVRGWWRRREGHTITHLRAIHAQRAIVVKHQPVEAEVTARSEWLRTVVPDWPVNVMLVNPKLNSVS